MRTVQDWLCRVDENKLCDEFIREYSLYDFTEFYFDKYKISELKNYVRGSVMEMIHTLQNMEISTVDESDKGIFYMVLTPDSSGFGETIPEMCATQDVINNEKFPETFVELDDFKANEWLGFYIAETELTLRNMYELLACIIWYGVTYGDDLDEIGKKLSRRTWNEEDWELTGEPEKKCIEPWEIVYGSWEAWIAAKISYESDDPDCELEDRMISVWQSGDEYKAYVKKREFDAVKKLYHQQE